MKEFAEALVCERKSGVIPDEHDLFGPLIGAWDFIWTDGDGGLRRVEGEWLFERTLDGTAVQDVFICPSRAALDRDRQPASEYGTTLRIYNPATEAWDIFYGCTGTAIRLEARCECGDIVQTEIASQRIRFVFSEIAENAFRWRRIETDDGTTWRVVGELSATRRK